MSGLARIRDHSPESERTRLALLVHLAAFAGDFSPKLSQAVDHATDAEVRVMSDLVDRGMSVPALVSLLQGAHVVIGDEELYQAWIFPNSRRRLSSHHRTIDKSATPDYGLDGPLVRESLHGKAAAGTWVQLERTKATFEWGKLPSWSDVVHMRDYVIYRATGKNVGPWGLSAHVDTRPMILRPPNTTESKGATTALLAMAQRRRALADDADERARWGDLLTPDIEPVGPVGDLYAAPVPDRPLQMLPVQPFSDDLGEGLFGSLSMVRARRPLVPRVARLLDAAPPPANLAAEEGRAERTQVSVREHTIVARAVLQRAANAPVFVGVQDVEVPDAGVQDAGVQDAGVQDAGVQDAGVQDAGVEEETT